MKCRFEDELIDALGRGFVGPELTAHAASCESCSELQLVAGALLDDHAVAVRDAAVPSSATMWWRMQMRHRHDVELAARRSLLIGQALTLAVAIALVAMLFGGQLTEGAHRAIEAVRSSTTLLVTVVLAMIAAPIATWATRPSSR
jgi:hypothetical protein